MTSKWVGMVVGSDTHQVYQTVMPDDDAQLDDPHWLLIHNQTNEPMRMIKILLVDLINSHDFPFGEEALLAAKL